MVFGMVAGLALAAGRHRIATIVGLVLVVLVLGPLVALALASAAIAAVAHRRARTKVQHAEETARLELRAVDIAGLATVAGVPFNQSMRIAAAECDGSVADAIYRCLRRTEAGLEPDASSEALAAVFAEAGRSVAVGGPLAPALTALSVTLRAERAARAKESLNKLPVKLLFPLAFLILPGFVLMAVGPTVAGGLSRISI